MFLIKKLVGIIFIFLIFGCNPKIKNFHQYKTEVTPKSSFMPSKEKLKGKIPKVVIFDFNENNDKTAKESALGKFLAIRVENILTKNRLVELVDRDIAKKLEKEIALLEMTGSSDDYKGPKIANYAISGSIAGASFSKQYKSSIMLYSKKTGFYKTSPKYKYKSKIFGNLKVYEIPSMTVLENLEFSGSSSKSEDVQRSGGISIAGILQVGSKSSGAQKVDYSLMRAASKKAIDKVSDVIKNFFAKKGYILEKKSLKNKFIFKVNLGFSDAIKHGDRFDVIGTFNVKNVITDEFDLEKRILAHGKVGNVINSKTSWVVLDKKEYNDMIRIGDAVKFKYKKNLIKKIISNQSLI